MQISKPGWIIDIVLTRRKHMCILNMRNVDKKVFVASLDLKPEIFNIVPLFTKRTDVLPQDLVKSPSREIGCYNDLIALTFDRYLGSSAAELPVKF